MKKIILDFLIIQNLFLSLSKINVMEGSEWSGLAAAGMNTVATIGNAYMAAKASGDDRAFAEKMYRLQREDAINDWNMQNQYNDPSNVMLRLAKAGLNPNLAVAQPVAAESVRSSSVPGYSSRTPQFNMDFVAMANLASQIAVNKSIANKNNAEAQLVTSQTKGQDLENQFKDATLQLRIDWEGEKRYETLVNIRHIENMTINEGLMTQANLNLNDEQRTTMAQARLYQVKDYDLRKWEIGENIKLQLENIAVGRIKAAAEYKSAAANMMRAITEGNLAAPEIAEAWLNYNYNQAYKENYPASEKATQDYIKEKFNIKEQESRERPRWYRIMQEGMRDLGYFISPVKIQM